MRTEAEGVSLVGEIMASFVLTQQQLDLVLREPEPTKLFLNGPPGSGKTVVLVLKATCWLNKGHDVHIVNTRPDALAASYLLKHMVQRNITEGDKIGRIHHDVYDFVNKDNDHSSLMEAMKTAASKCERLFIVCDDVWARNDRYDPNHAYVPVMSLPLSEFRY